MRVKIDRRTGILFGVLGLVFVVPPLLVCLLFEMGAVANLTPSMPRGIYWTTNAPLTQGAVVSYRAPDTPDFAEAKARGYYKVNIIKKIVGMPGDVFSITNDGVIVNGSLLPNTVPLTADPQGRALPHYRVSQSVVNGGELLLLSDYSTLSFDGRYVGAVKAADVNCVLRPVWLFD